MIPNTTMIPKSVAGVGYRAIISHKSCHYTIRCVWSHSYVTFLARTVDGLHLGLQPAEGMGYLLSQP